MFHLREFSAGALVAPLNAGYNRFMPSVSQTIRVKVLFFGRLKEVLGCAEESLELAGNANIEAVFAAYVARFPQLHQYRSSLVASCNREFAAWNTALHAGDEIAFLPPVGGG